MKFFSVFSTCASPTGFYSWSHAKEYRGKVWSSINMGSSPRWQHCGTAGLPEARRVPCPPFSQTKQPPKQPSRTSGFPNALAHGHFVGDGLRAAFVRYTERIIAWLSRVVAPFTHSFGEGGDLQSGKVAMTSSAHRINTPLGKDSKYCGYL